MSKRGENIHKRKDGRWEGRYKKGRNLKGEIIYGSVYGKTYRETKDKLACASFAPKEKPHPRNQERYFREVLSLWMDNNQIRHKGATVNKYQYLINKHILPDLGSLKLSQITATVINTFLTQKMQNGKLDKTGGLSASYVRSIMLIISAAMKFAADEQMCLPLKSPINKPIVHKKEISILSKEEYKRLETYLLLGIDSTRIGVLISLNAGLRIGEVCALTWDDIDMENHIIHVRHTIARVKNSDNSNANTSKLVIDTPKTKASARDIPISSMLLSVLKQKNMTALSNYVISDTNDFVSPRTYEYRYHRLLDECGVQSVNYHVLRHTFATRCIEAGVDVKSLSEILGHSSVSITLNTYVHSSMEMKRSQLEKLSIFN